MFAAFTLPLKLCCLYNKWLPSTHLCPRIAVVFDCSRWWTCLILEFEQKVKLINHCCVCVGCVCVAHPHVREEAESYFDSSASFPPLIPSGDFGHTTDKEKIECGIFREGYASWSLETLQAETTAPKVALISLPPWHSWHCTKHCRGNASGTVLHRNQNPL